ncbi:hypothetical protein GAMM_100057 [Gammaproteobacteria bacterium]
MRKQLLLSVLIAIATQVFSEDKYVLKKIIADRPNIVWQNSSVHGVTSLLSEKISEINSMLNIHNAIVTTPLKHLDSISEIVGKEVYLKDDSLQNTGSFKVRGVANEVYAAISSYIERTEFLLDDGIKPPLKPFYVVTQSDGNHGIAMIAAVAFIVHNQVRLRPELAEYIKNIEPIVFTIKALPEVKKAKMYAALNHYRDTVGNHKKGSIIIRGNYLEAKNAGKEFVSKNFDNAAYMEHGGYHIMCGHASIGVEIDKQLHELGVDSEKKVAFVVPVGTGGSVGMILGLKAKRPRSLGIIVQTRPYSALIRSLKAQKLVSNEPNLEPTIVLKGKKLFLKIA